MDQRQGYSQKGMKGYWNIQTVLGLFLQICLAGASGMSPPSFLSFLEDGTIVYGQDLEGNQVPDFSYCGYEGGRRPIPDIPVCLVVSPAEGDNTLRIQAALDYAASLPLKETGFRGAVLLRRGRYSVSGSLFLSASGVVLRGEGMGEDGTVLVATGTDRRTLIRIAGRNDRSWSSPAYPILDARVPVGSTVLHIESSHELNVGDTIVITRLCTQEWLEQNKINCFGGGLKGIFDWKVGSREVRWERVVRAVREGEIILDAPLTAVIDSCWGGGTVRRCRWPGRIHHVGVENLRCRSEYDLSNLQDENHSWMTITIENAENVWLRRITSLHFAGSLAAVWETAKSVTVQDCLSIQPISERGGWRRNTFFTSGQMTLFLRCFSEEGCHDFSVGYCAAGPNAFVQCHSLRSLDDSGPLESWACGVLYDNVRIDGNALRLGWRGSQGEGIGWAAANSVLWQCESAVVECGKPPTACNWAFGCWGEFEGDGYWEKSNTFLKPASLYAAQLAQRLGREAAQGIYLMKAAGSSTTAPSVETAAEMTALSAEPASSLKDFIQETAAQNPIFCDLSEAKVYEQVLGGRWESASRKPMVKPVQLLRGRMVCQGRLAAGSSIGPSWWRGSTRPDEAADYGVGITRFVPGRIGAGFTDDLNELTDKMVACGQIVMDYNYGLWYDRRREDHQRVRRMNGRVRPPFYEQPFDRSGVGTAWDGLSKYDLTRYDSWYWARLKEFADLCDQKGLVLVHHNYFQHNLLEAGAHWADFPWRPANNINNTGFPEPPPYAGDKRIYMAELFYDVSHPVRRPLHQAYIQKCLDAFADNTNVLQLTSAEYTGPLEFVQFWLDTIDQWQKKTHRKPLAVLSCTKDVQDAILADPVRRDIVSVIDIRYWWYQADGTVYAPRGGQNLSPRQHARLLNPKPASFEQVVRTVRDYRSRYPDKAVLFSADSRFGWAVLLGGGSLPQLPVQTDSGLLEAVLQMEPMEWPVREGRCLALSDGGTQSLIYVLSGSRLFVPQADGGEHIEVRRIDMNSGRIAASQVVDGGQEQELPVGEVPALFWLIRKSSSEQRFGR